MSILNHIIKIHKQHHHGNNDNICVSIVPIFNHLEKSQMLEVNKLTTSSSYKKGEIIYSSGDQSDSLYIVSKGKIKIYRLSESGKEQLVRILNDGDFTGELSLFNESIHEAYAQAMEETQVCIVNRHDFQKLLLKYPSISLKVMSEFANRLDKSEKQTTDFATEKVETRIAKFLIECSSSSNSNEISLPMSKKDLASYLGTTPETISRKLLYLEEENLIKQETNKKIKILNIDDLLLV